MLSVLLLQEQGFDILPLRHFDGNAVEINPHIIGSRAATPCRQGNNQVRCWHGDADLLINLTALHLDGCYEQQNNNVLFSSLPKHPKFGLFHEFTHSRTT